MAQHCDSIKIKIQDLRTFQRLVSAIGGWAEEIRVRGHLTDSEKELYEAAVEQAEKASER